ncbi:MAG: hypothetical protein H7233_04685 [Pseudorhodobacter sp.]|nr:hypothetical protein [Frankiaceae bacterium]
MTDDELAELKRLAHLYGTTELDQHASFDLADDLRVSIVRASSDDSSSDFVRGELTRLRTEVERLQSALLSTAAALADRTAELAEARELARHMHKLLEENPHLLHGGLQPEYPWLAEGAPARDEP